jgi:L-ascorbate metabolism protein UlaG (beta-lactamase superfamily)
MKLTYYGHSCFVLESDGTAILIDPYDAEVGYPLPTVAPAAVVVSHEHHDHNNVQVATGKPKVIRGLRDGGKEWAEVRERVGPVAITTVHVYHDDARGAKRGKNAMFIFDAEGLRVVHAGDLAHPLSPEQIAAVDHADVLLLPVGGHFTIGAQQADAVIGQVKPRITVPMHYKTGVNADWPIGTVEDFVRGKSRVKRLGKSATITKATLPAEPEIWVLQV